MKIAELQKRARQEWQARRNGEPVIWFGLATCGLAAGAGELVEAVQAELSELGIRAQITPTGCIGACFAEPMMDIERPGQPRICYAELTPEKARSIVRTYLGEGDPCADQALGTLGEETIAGVPRLFDLPMFAPQVRIATRNAGLINPEEITHYLAAGGYAGLERALGMSPEEVIEEITASGLRGRGGAGFPTGRKWGFARQAEGEPKYLICNADEGDPGAFMDRAVLESDPHSVLEGMLIAAYAIGASEGFMYVRSEYPLAIQRLSIALDQMRANGLLGENIAGSGFSFEITLKEGAGAFVCGEETAMIASLEGKRGQPRPRPPFPVTSGLWGKPTTINNVETLANVPAIMAKGAAWFASYGTEKSKGTKTFSLTGKVKRSGLIEVPMGMTLGEVIYSIGGGILRGRKLKAIQTGGPSGGCLPASLVNLPIDYESLAGAGSIMGSGGLVVLDEDNCIVDMARYFLSFTQRESCGKCPPCRLGTRQMLAMLEDFCAGRGRREDLDLLVELAQAVKASSLCGLGQSAPNPVLTTVRYFREEYEAHLLERRCPAAACWALFRAPCEHTCPAGVNVPIYVGQIAAGEFSEALDTIRHTMPFASVCGRVCHHPCESRCLRGQHDDPVAVKALKRFAGDYLDSGKRRRKLQPAPPNGHAAAIIGGGPAGLAAAWELARRGYRVKIYEAQPVLGGMLAWGIPEYRLPKAVLMREIKDLLQLGVEVETGVKVGEDISLERILADGYDAVFVAVGAGPGATLNVPGVEKRGVLQAVDLLRQANLVSLRRRRTLPKLGRRVVVVGGGSAAMDAARTALRLGAQEVHVLYRRSQEEMPAQPEEVAAALQEGVQIRYLAAPVQVLGKDSVTGVECVKMRLGEYDRSGRRRPVPMAGSEFTLEADTVVLALGQQLEAGVAAFLPITAEGRVEADPVTLRTPLPRVYAGGDAVTGAATVIEAIGQGLRAARAIDFDVRGVPMEATFLPESHPAPAEEAEIPPQRRVGRGQRPPEARAGDFAEVELGYTAEEARCEADRCLRCHLSVAARVAPDQA